MAWRTRPVDCAPSRPAQPWCDPPIVDASTLVSGYAMAIGGGGGVPLGALGVWQGIDTPGPMMPKFNPMSPSTLPSGLPDWSGTLKGFGVDANTYVPRYLPGSALGEFVVGLSPIGVIPAQPTQSELETELPAVQTADDGS